VVAVKVGLVTLGFARAMRVIEWLVAGRADAVVPADGRVDAVARGVVTAAVFCPGRVECLEQSMALYYLLRRHGVSAELRFGVRTTTPFAAHAWVVHRGIAVHQELEQLEQVAVFE
jgi:transglutaminase-like putative cysteine protease